MIYKQCKFWDNDSDKDGGLGGIAILEDYGYGKAQILQGVICGCCGGFVEPDDIVDIKYYDDWVNIEDFIRGDE